MTPAPETAALRSRILACIPENVPLRGRYVCAVMAEIAPILADRDAATAREAAALAERDEARKALSDALSTMHNQSRRDAFKAGYFGEPKDGLLTDAYEAGFRARAILNSEPPASAARPDPGAAAAQARIAELEGAIRSYLDGNYDGPRSHRPGQCRHGVFYYATCESCIDEHFAVALPPGDQSHD